MRMRVGLFESKNIIRVEYVEYSSTRRRVLGTALIMTSAGSAIYSVVAAALDALTRAVFSCRLSIRQIRKGC